MTITNQLRNDVPIPFSKWHGDRLLKHLTEQLHSPKPPILQKWVNMHL